MSLNHSLTYKYTYTHSRFCSIPYDFKYYFDDKRKIESFFSLILIDLIRFHHFAHIYHRDPLESQRRVAMISEMIHTASLIHDDVIDQSNFRRGKPSVNVLWNHRKVSESQTKNIVYTSKTQQLIMHIIFMLDWQSNELFFHNSIIIITILFIFLYFVAIAIFILSTRLANVKKREAPIDFSFVSECE